MNASALIDNLKTHGILLSAVENRLVYEAPENAITPEIIQTLKEHKAEILNTLTAQQRRKQERLLPEFERAREKRLNSSDPAIRETWEKVAQWPVINQAAFGVRVGLLVKDGMPEAKATDQIFKDMEPFVSQKIIQLKKRTNDEKQTA